ncbi:hypothetical protein R6Q59_003815 [Mikania micrantha]
MRACSLVLLRWLSAQSAVAELPVFPTAAFPAVTERMSARPGEDEENRHGSLASTQTPKGCPPPPPPPCPLTPNIPTPSPQPKDTCPINVLKFGVCVNLINGLTDVVIGTQPNAPCCTLIEGLADLEAAVCLCAAIKANVLGINLNIPVTLSVLVNSCGKKVPSGFQCA